MTSQDAVARWSGPRGWWARLVVLLAAQVGTLSRLLGRGAGRTLPGRVALLLAPDLLTRLARGRRVVLVTGTNGKSTTTCFTTAAVGCAGPVLTNGDGANLLPGLVGALMRDTDGTTTAVLEVDEVWLPKALDAMDVECVVLLNLSRDQLDRVGEVAGHVDRWAAALRTHPGTRVVANADDPKVCHAVRTARPDEAGVTWVAAGWGWRNDSPLCPFCGAPWDTEVARWHCASCGASAPAPAWSVDAGEVLAPGGERVALRLGVPGRTSAVNATVAAAVAAGFGVPAQQALQALSVVREVDGRYLGVELLGKQVLLLLGKNPAGWRELLTYVAGEPGRLVLGLNARAADGRDPSWIWDVPFEELRGRDVVVFGERALDLSVRLSYAEVTHTVEQDLLRAVGEAAGDEVLVVANYTAFVQARGVIRSAATAAA